MTLRTPQVSPTANLSHRSVRAISRHKMPTGAQTFTSARTRPTARPATGSRPCRARGISRSSGSTARPRQPSIRVGSRATSKMSSDTRLVTLNLGASDVWCAQEATADVAGLLDSGRWRPSQRVDLAHCRPPAKFTLLNFAERPVRSGESVADRPKAGSGRTELIAGKLPFAACGGLQAGNQE